MATYTITINDSDVSVFTAFCNAKGSKPVANPKEGEPTSTPWTITDYVQDMVNGHIDYAKKLAAQNDEATKAAKLSEYEVIKPTYDKLEALKAEEAQIVNDILDGKITASDITVAEVVKP